MLCKCVSVISMKEGLVFLCEGYDSLRVKKVSRIHWVRIIWRGQIVKTQPPSKIQANNLLGWVLFLVTYGGNPLFNSNSKQSVRGTGVKVTLVLSSVYAKRVYSSLAWGHESSTWRRGSKSITAPWSATLRDRDQSTWCSYTSNIFWCNILRSYAPPRSQPQACACCC